MLSSTRPRTLVVPLAGLAIAGLLLAGCSATGTPATGAAAGSTSSAGVVLPVPSDPISNASTQAGLTISSVLVENNVDPATGKDAPDHLEIVLANSLTTPLTKVEVYYTFTDPSTGDTEGYYTDLGPGFTVPAGGERIVHFDGATGADHFPVSPYSLYATSTNALDVTVEVSADGVAVQRATVAKDAGGAENPGE